MNDASSARPEGSMEVCKVYWWKHNCLAGQYSSAKVHNSLKVEVKNDVDTPNCFEDFTITLSPLEDLEPEIYDGI
jgi:CRISPR-associated protein Csd2